MSVALTFAQTMTVIETLTDPSISGGGNPTVTHNQYNQSASLTGASTPPVTKVAALDVVLIAGAKTIDLTAIAGTNGAVLDMSGLKVQALLFKNKSASANVMSIEPGAANGYDAFGADFKVTLQPGQSVLLYGNDATPDVAGADAEIDFAGTLVQEGELIVVCG